MLERFWFGCGHCHGEAECPWATELENAAKPPTGVARLPIPLTAATVFLWPLACAIGGAFLGGRWWAGDTPASVGCWQMLGALAGLTAGVVSARLLLFGMYRIWTRLGRGGE